MDENAETTNALGAIARPPVVVVMGHIDHGKTTLLDAIRKTAVAEKEAGGITQAIGAYQADHNGKKITFIDTPGHEAFTAMRSRGARVADIAVLVVAADEGIKPQTEEAINIIRENDLPFLVAINKIDKPNADPPRVKNKLAELSILVEGFGGKVPVVELSAKSGRGIDELLETILLMAEFEELKSDPEKSGEGLVIESHLDPKRGATATLLVRDGTVRRGDFIVTGGDIAPVRIFENFRGEAIEAASASEPIRVTGFAGAPKLGEKFRIFKTRPLAEEHKAAPGAPKEPTNGAMTEAGKHVVNIILKTDVLGSREAVAEAISKIGSQELSNRIIKGEVGDINESDVKLAAATKNAFIAGFKVKMPAGIRELSERSNVTVVASDVIYELIDAVKSAMLSIAPAEIKRVSLGAAKILAVFHEEKARQIVGGRVESGKLEKGSRFEIMRNGMKIGAGKIIELQSQKRAVAEVAEGQEFGILADADTSIAVGDNMEVFGEEKIIPRL